MPSSTFSSLRFRLSSILCAASCPPWSCECGTCASEDEEEEALSVLGWLRVVMLGCVWGLLRCVRGGSGCLYVRRWRSRDVGAPDGNYHIMTASMVGVVLAKLGSMWRLPVIEIRMREIEAAGLVNVHLVFLDYTKNLQYKIHIAVTSTCNFHL